MQTGEHLFVHVGDAARRLYQTISIRVFADRFQDQADSILEFWECRLWIRAFRVSQ